MNCKAINQTRVFVYGMIHIWCPWKLSNFQNPPHHLSIYVQNSFIPLSLDVQFQMNPPLQIIINQLKENIIKGWLLYDVRSFLQVGFRFQFQLVNLVCLSFHLDKASLSAFSWLYTLVCVAVQNYNEMFFIYIYHLFNYSDF